MAMIACFDMDGGRGGFTNGFFAHGFDIDSSGGSDKVSPANARVEPADRFAAGAPSVVPEDAPRPEHFPTGRTHAQIVALFAGKSQRREQGIARVLEDARAKGKPVDRFVACITYDSEFAPKTTNRRQLLELGDAEQEARRAAEQTAARVDLVLGEGLAQLAAFFFRKGRLLRMLPNRSTSTPWRFMMKDWHYICVALTT